MKSESTAGARAAFLFILASGTVSAAWANSTVPSGGGRLCAASVRCRALAEQARVHSRTGAFADAATSYEQAWQEVADPFLLFQLGRVHHKLGHSEQALDYYYRYIEAGAEGSNVQEERTRQLIAQLASPRVSLGPVVPVPTPAVGTGKLLSGEVNAPVPILPAQGGMTDNPLTILAKVKPIKRYRALKITFAILGGIGGVALTIVTPLVLLSRAASSYPDEPRGWRIN